MNASYRFDAPIYSIEHGHWHTFTANDVQEKLDDGAWDWAGIDTRKSPSVVNFGTTLGFTGEIALGVPLCRGCDAPLDNGVCDDCEVICPDAPTPNGSIKSWVVLPVSDLGNGRSQVSA